MLKGIDISTWQNVGTGDGDYDFVICKATGSDAGNYVDSKCDQHYQRAKSQGKLLGVYHFANPVGSAEAQADFFVDNIQGYIGEALLVLDWEYGDTSNVAWAKAWLDRVYERTGVKPLVYMSGSVCGQNDWSSVVAGDYGLWQAYWLTQYEGGGYPSSPDENNYGTGAWPFWAIWQFTSRGGTLDCDVFNGDREAWLKYAGKNSSTDPTPTPAPTPARKTVEELAKEVIEGKWGNGQERKDRLTAEGYDYDAVQNRVNEIVQPAVEMYTIRPGDTLSAIAARYGTTWQYLADLNGIANPDYIRAGDTIRVK